MTFFELEKECKKRQKRLFIIAISIVVAIVSLLFYLVFYLIERNNIRISGKKNKNIEVNKTEKKMKIISSNLENKKIKNNFSINQFSLNKEKSNEIKTSKEFILKPILDLNISDENNHEKSISKKVGKENSKIQDKKIEKNANKDIFTATSLPSVETCIKLAKNYYEKGDYKEALKWAKNANLQNKKDKRSWIIVAKSLYKLGKKQKAIDILQIYYNYTKDNEVLKVIDRMKNGNI